MTRLQPSKLVSVKTTQHTQLHSNFVLLVEKDLQKPVVLGYALTPRRSTAFHKISSNRNREIGNKSVFGSIAGAMRDSHHKTGFLCHSDKLESFGQSADLIRL